MESKFTVGTKVALISHGFGFGDSRISVRRVWKVRKDGKFYLSLLRDGETVQLDQMWTPDSSGTLAHQSGRDRSAREHCQVWNEDHDRRLADRKREFLAVSQRERLIKHLGSMNVRDKDDQDRLQSIVDDLSNRGWLPAEKESA